MNVLLDTCSFLWAAEDPGSLSKDVAAVLADPQTRRFLSAVTVWEVAIKHRLGHLETSAPPSALVQKAIADLMITPLPLEIADALLEPSLPPHHKDPFDRMLICQAMARNLTILTPDRLIQQYGASCLW